MKHIQLALLIISVTYFNNVIASASLPVDLSNWLLTKSLNSSDASVELNPLDNSITLHGSNSGSGRHSIDELSIDVPLSSSSSSVTVTKNSFTEINGNGRLYPVMEYEARLESILIGFNWTYYTDDLDGAKLDSLFCTPVCGGYDSLGSQSQSGYTEISFSDHVEYHGPYLGTLLLPDPNELEITGIPSSLLFSVGIDSTDSRFGAGHITLSNFTMDSSFREISGRVFFLPLPGSLLFFSSALIGSLFLPRRLAANKT